MLTVYTHAYTHVPTHTISMVLKYTGKKWLGEMCNKRLLGGNNGKDLRHTAICLSLYGKLSVRSMK